MRRATGDREGLEGRGRQEGREKSKGNSVKIYTEAKTGAQKQKDRIKKDYQKREY